MIKVDLITGFLGSGKTTFLRKYVQYLLSQNERIGVLLNDHGAVNVDMLLLSDLRGERLELEMVAGGCDADCHKRRFKTKLIAMGMSGYDRVIIEPSGIFDVDEFFDALREEPLENWYEIGNVITIVDALLPEETTEVDDFVIASQLANAGCVLLSKVQKATPKQLENTMEHLKRAAMQVKCKKEMDELVLAKDWDVLTDEDYAKLTHCGYSFSDYVKMHGQTQASFETIYLLEEKFTKAALLNAISELFATEGYGDIYRIKGFFQEKDRWIQVNATPKEIGFATQKVGQEVLIVIGKNLKKDAILERLKSL